MRVRLSPYPGKADSQGAGILDIPPSCHLRITRANSRCPSDLLARSKRERNIFWSLFSFCGGDEDQGQDLHWVAFYPSLRPTVCCSVSQQGFLVGWDKKAVSKPSFVLLHPTTLPRFWYNRQVCMLHSNSWMHSKHFHFENASWGIFCGWWVFCLFSNSSLLYSAPELLMVKICLFKRWSQADSGTDCSPALQVLLDLPGVSNSFTCYCIVEELLVGCLEPVAACFRFPSPPCCSAFSTFSYSWALLSQTGRKQ